MGMNVQKIIAGIGKAPLSDDVRARAIDETQARSKELEEMCRSFVFKAPSAHEDWGHEVTRKVMGIITPGLREAEVSEMDGTNTYTHIYASIMGEDPSKYLEVA